MLNRNESPFDQRHDLNHILVVKVPDHNSGGASGYESKLNKSLYDNSKRNMSDSMSDFNNKHDDSSSHSFKKGLIVY